jgi:hypothetical protein
MRWARARALAAHWPGRGAARAWRGCFTTPVFSQVARPEEEVVLEVLAPERGVFHARLGEGAVEVEHAHEAGPGAAPVGDGEDGSLVRDEAGQHMVRVLPDRLGDDQRRLGIDAGKHLHAFLLGGDETVLQGGLVGMGADQFATEFGDGGRQGLLHGMLGGPADFVGGLAEIAAGDEEDFHGFGGVEGKGDGIAAPSPAALRMHSKEGVRNG